MNKGYHVAAPGAIVEVADGTYPEQFLEQPVNGSASQPITFRPAAGQTVTVSGRVVFHTSNITFDGGSSRGFTVGHFRLDERENPVWNSADNIRLLNFTAHVVSSIGGDNVEVAYCEIANSNLAYADDTIQIGSYNSNPSNWNIHHCSIHDARHVSSTSHSDGLQTTGVVGLRFHHNRIWNADDQTFMLKDDQGPVGDVLIENNFIGRPLLGVFSVNLGDAYYTCSGIRMRYNSILGPLRADHCGGGSEYLGNIGASPPNPIYAGWTVTCNWWETQRGDPGYVNRAALDLHLLAGSAAIDQGCSPFPADDIDGQARPLGVAPDAGADEAS